MTSLTISCPQCNAHRSGQGERAQSGRLRTDGEDAGASRLIIALLFLHLLYSVLSRTKKRPGVPSRKHRLARVEESYRRYQRVNTGSGSRLRYVSTRAWRPRGLRTSSTRVSAAFSGCCYLDFPHPLPPHANSHHATDYSPLAVSDWYS